MPGALLRKIFVVPLLIATFAVAAQESRVQDLRRADNGMPLMVIYRDTFNREGFTQLGDVIRFLTQNTHVNDAFNADNSRQFFNLRDLGGPRTLILLDGERLPVSALNQQNGQIFDARTLSLAGISRIEVLPASAGVMYGSGAVAGVINLISDRDQDGVMGRAQVEATADGGAERTSMDFRYGAQVDNQRFAYALSYQRTEPLYAAERDFSATADQHPDGLDFRSTTSSPPNAVPINPLQPQTNLVDPACPTEQLGVSAVGQVACLENPNQYLQLSGAEERINLLGNADWFWQNGVTLDLGFAFSRGRANQNFQRINADPLEVQTDHPSNPFGLPVFIDSSLPGVAPAENYNQDKLYLVSADIDGHLGRWGWHTGINYARSETRLTHRNALDRIRLQRALFGDLPGFGFYDPFGNAPENGPGLIDAFTTDWRERARWQQTDIELGLSREFALFGERGLQFELFGQAGSEDLFQDADNVFATRDLVDDPRVLQVNQKRGFSATGFRLAIPFHARFLLTAGLRSDRYEDVDDAQASHDLTLVYQTTDQIQFRTGWSSGFRMPNLAETHGDVVSQTLLLVHGNPDLIPEQSETFNFGMTWVSSDLPGLSVGVETWKTNLTNVIVTVVDPDAPRLLIPLNMHRRQTQTAELEARYQFETEQHGSFNFALVNTFVERFQTEFRNRLSGAFTRPLDNSELSPDSRFRFESHWNYGSHGVSAMLHYYSDYRSPVGRIVNGVITAEEQFVESWQALDLQYRFTLNAVGRGELRVGCRNCLGEDPGFYNLSAVGFNQSLADPRGAQFYVGWEQNF